MEINPRIEDKLEGKVSNFDACILTMLAIHFNLKSAIHISEKMEELLLKNSLIEKLPGGGYKNLIHPIGREDERFEWVKSEYVAMFKEKNSRKGGHIKESANRFKKFFKENPQYGKQEVLRATRLYLDSTDYQFIRFPHYFISKGSGDNRVEEILTWIEKLEELDELEKSKSKENVPLNFKLQ